MERYIGVDVHAATCTLARIIAATGLRMWKDGEEYEPDRHRRAMESDRNA